MSTFATVTLKVPVELETDPGLMMPDSCEPPYDSLSGLLNTQRLRSMESPELHRSWNRVAPMTWIPMISSSKASVLH